MSNKIYLSEYRTSRKSAKTGISISIKPLGFISWPRPAVTTKYVYVMEFKLNGTAEEALQQINDKQYALPFAADSREVFKIGVNFSNTTRNIERWVVEEL